MLKKINYALMPFYVPVCNLAIWKKQFEDVNAELSVTKLKMEALDNLYNSGKISQFVYECLNKELAKEIENVQARIKALAEKMTSKLNELEEQRIALEIFLANTAMAYVAGEINEELYPQENSAIELGLETTKKELSLIRDVVIQFVPKEAESTTEHIAVSAVENTEENTTETPVQETTETTSNAPVEVPVELPTTTSEANVEPIQQLPTETPSITQTESS
jgi:hypothetical protein